LNVNLDIVNLTATLILILKAGWRNRHIKAAGHWLHIALVSLRSQRLPQHRFIAQTKCTLCNSSINCQYLYLAENATLTKVSWVFKVLI